MRVAFILPSLANYGGVKSVVQLANGLLQRDFDTEIILTQEPADPGWFEVLARFGPLRDYMKRKVDLGGRRVFVATRHDTVSTALSLARSTPRSEVVYFAQDYEPDFYEPGSTQEAEAEASYRHRLPIVVKSEWLRRKLSAYGHKAHLIELGVNTDIFFRGEGPRHFSLAAQVRPSSSRRNWPFLRKVILEFARRRPEEQVALLGANLEDQNLPKSVTNLGIIPETEVGKLMRDSSLVLDPSLFQGFGRPGLEGLLAGAVPIVTPFGGITQWATHELNSLLVPPVSVHEWVETVVSLLENSDEMNRLLEGSLGYIDRFSVEREVAEWAELLQDIAPG